MESETNRIGRVIKILTTLQSGGSFNVDTLSQVLQTSRRTIFRDLKDLRKAGVPVYYDDKNHRYVIEAEPFWPVDDLNAQEILSLLLLVHKAKDHIHLPFNNLALTAARKIERNLPDEVKRCCDDALQDISIKAYQPTRTEALDNTFLQIRQAVIKRRAVIIRYCPHDEQDAVETELNPYHIVYVNDAWYVVGQTEQQEIRTFKLNRIKELNVLDKSFAKDKEFNIQEYLSKAWAAMPEGKLYDIRLEFQPEIARSVTEVQWHSTQAVTFAPDGSAIVEFQVDGLNELIPWVLSYGDKVKVIRPEALRQEIIRINQKTIEQNRTFGYSAVS